MPAITSTQGASYEAADAGQNSVNLQAAIDGVSAAGGGAVFVWEDLDFDSRIVLRSNVILDFMNNQMTLTRSRGTGGPNAFLIEHCEFAQVRNVKILPTVGHLSPIILIRSESASSPTQFNLVEHITILNGYGAVGDSYPDHFFDGVILSVTNGGLVRANSVRNIKMSGVNVAVQLVNPEGPSARLEDNLISCIQVDGFQRLIDFIRLQYLSTPTFVGIDRNLFEHIVGVAHDWTEHGITRVCGVANHFEHVGIINWHKARSYANQGFDWRVSGLASATYICAYNIDKGVDPSVDDDGADDYPTIYDPPSNVYPNIHASTGADPIFDGALLLQYLSTHLTLRGHAA